MPRDKDKRLLPEDKEKILNKHQEGQDYCPLREVEDKYWRTNTGGNRTAVLLGR